MTDAFIAGIIVGVFGTLFALGTFVAVSEWLVTRDGES